MSRADWIWMGHPAHLCVSDRCQFRLSTYVNGYIISTVGEYVPNSNSKKFTEIGYNRTYETMVFKAIESDSECCPYEADVTNDELDMEGYNTAKDAMNGHYKMCEKWDGGQQ